MEHLLKLFQNGGFKMMDGSGSLFNNTWRHYDITAIFKIIYALANFLILSDAVL